MLNLIIRISLLLLSLGLATWQYVIGYWGNGVFLTVLALLIGFTFWKNERIIIALWNLQKNKLDKALKNLQSIKDPEKALIKQQLASYYFLIGVCLSQKSVHEAEKYFRLALDLKKLSKQEQAMAKLQLAGVAAQKGKKQEAERLLSEAKKLDTKHLLDEHITMFKNNLKRISTPSFYQQQQSRGVKRR